jgi:hypothetical protein
MDLLFRRVRIGGFEINSTTRQLHNGQATANRQRPKSPS